MWNIKMYLSPYLVLTWFPHIENEVNIWSPESFMAHIADECNSGHLPSSPRQPEHIKGGVMEKITTVDFHLSYCSP